MRCMPWLLLWLLLAPWAQAQDRPAVLVTDPEARSYRVALQLFANPTDDRDRDRAARLRREIRSALEYSGLFETIDPKAFLASERTVSLEERPVCLDWTQIRADALVQGDYRIEPGTRRMAVEFRVTDVARSCRTLKRHRYRGGIADERRIAKRVADDIVGAFTGIKGVASTEIAYVSDAPGNYEVHVMDATGENVRRVTHNGSINQFPTWHPDGNNILYTSYRQGRGPRLFLLGRQGRSAGRILEHVDATRSVYRGRFRPDGKRVALVMSLDGGAEIFTASRNGRSLKRLTRNRSIDISPSWSPDGRRVAFVSDRAGSPQIYVMDRDGSDVRRITFNGSYNTSPAWSPDGKWIAYEARMEGQFDIWLIDPEGEVNVPLVSHPRSDEAPSWAPDGRKLAFSSTRRGRADIFQIGIDGSGLERITRGGSNHKSPAWGPYPR